MCSEKVSRREQELFPDRTSRVRRRDDRGSNAGPSEPAALRAPALKVLRSIRGVQAARSPELYTQGIARGYYTHRIFFLWMADAAWLAVVALGVPILALSTQPAGGPGFPT